MSEITRRSFVAQSAAALALSGVANAKYGGDSPRAGMTLGFSTYGMKSLKTERAIEVISEIGFDAVEITVWPDWDASPVRMDKIRRVTVRKKLAGNNLKLTSLMEHVYPSADDAQHKKDLERFRGVFQLAQDLSPTNPPVVQTVLGGGRFDKQKNMLLDRVGDWVELGKHHGVVTCVKPHRGGVVSQPSEAIWILRQLEEPRWARMVYDYSHYIFRGIPFVESIRDALPFTSHVAVKDTVKKGTGTEFKLPGEAGTIDYVTLLKELAKGGYSGDISCEVSGMVSGKAGYEPIAAARTCYKNLSAAFENSGVNRG
jgi:sugar phosphate isomerase/epimerase